MRSGLHSLMFVLEDEKAEKVLRTAHINVLSFWLMGELQDNHWVYNKAAVRILKEGKVRGRRREILERFIGKIAAARFSGELKMEEELSWQG